MRIVRCFVFASVRLCFAYGWVFVGLVGLGSSFIVSVFIWCRYFATDEVPSVGWLLVYLRFAVF